MILTNFRLNKLSTVDDHMLTAKVRVSTYMTW